MPRGFSAEDAAHDFRLLGLDDEDGVRVSLSAIEINRTTPIAIAVAARVVALLHAPRQALTRSPRGVAARTHAAVVVDRADEPVFVASVRARDEARVVRPQLDALFDQFLDELRGARAVPPEPAPVRAVNTDAVAAACAPDRFIFA